MRMWVAQVYQLSAAGIAYNERRQKEGGAFLPRLARHAVFDLTMVALDGARGCWTVNYS
jgi:hypothetical protein